jgi:hypothetical protein
MTKWRYFAADELPLVIRELGIPCARPVRVTGMTHCPRHREPLGSVTRMCLACHDEAWTEVGRRYALPVRNAQAIEERKEIQMTLPTDEIVDELELYEAPPVASTLFGTSDPELALARQARIAELLVGVVKNRKLVKRISGNEYLLAPAWAVLGGMTGLTPSTAWTKPLEDGTGYIARVEVRRVADGAVISAAEQVCTRSESKWSKADDHALIGMAQTRATSRAFRGPLMQIVELAGYKPTPAEEMPDDVESERPPFAPAGATREQQQRIRELIRLLADREPKIDWKARAQDLAGVPASMLSGRTAALLIHALETEIESLASAA